MNTLLKAEPRVGAHEPSNAFARRSVRSSDTLTAGAGPVVLSTTIRAPIIKEQSAPPKGPSWTVVRRLIDSLDASNPSQCRARAILLLASIYGMRTCGIARLNLDDLDWCGDVLTVHRAKHGRSQQFPIQPEVGWAIILYLQKVRPSSAFRNVFLTLHAPYPFNIYHSRCGVYCGTELSVTSHVACTHCGMLALQSYSDGELLYMASPICWVTAACVR